MGRRRVERLYRAEGSRSAARPGEKTAGMSSPDAIAEHLRAARDDGKVGEQRRDPGVRRDDHVAREERAAAREDTDACAARRGGGSRVGSRGLDLEDRRALEDEAAGALDAGECG